MSFIKYVTNILVFFLISNLINYFLLIINIHKIIINNFLFAIYFSYLFYKCFNNSFENLNLITLFYTPSYNQ